MNAQFGKVVGCNLRRSLRLRLSFPGFAEDASVVLYTDLTSSPSQASSSTLFFLEKM
jgi:hypothetical protein